MPEQRSLFADHVPATHATDPDSSAEAEERHTESGARGRNCQLVLSLVKEHPGLTGAELYMSQSRLDPLGLDLYEVRRRLSDLKNAGRIVQAGQRKCRVSNTSAVTWEIAE